MSNRRVDWWNHPCREEMVKAYMALAKFANFKVGDTVKVVRDWENGELGCPCSTPSQYVGKTGIITVEHLSNDGTVFVKFGNGNFGNSGWRVPFHVLELIEPVEETVKVTVEKNGTSKEMEFTEEEWAKIESTIN